MKTESQKVKNEFHILHFTTTKLIKEPNIQYCVVQLASVQHCNSNSLLPLLFFFEKNCILKLKESKFIGDLGPTVAISISVY